ncbi:branched-chain amino acid ABC transporter permease [Actinomadura sp. 1N219]|uniref:branched-chain amino acid ABC transporter permease n=1 Tax=Actinomadura sp. 1N219 TaxID=3375152 RepID=UPI00378A2CA0
MNLLVPGLIGGLVYGAIVALITSGMTLIYRVSGIIDFAHGSLLAVAMYLGFDLARQTGLDPLLTAVVTTLVLAGLGLLIYWAGVHPIRRRHHLLAVQLLLGVTFVISSLLLLRYGGDVRSAPNIASSHYVDIFGTGLELVRVIAAVAAVVALTGLGLAVQHTDWGRRLRAAASDEMAAALCGVDRTKLEAWAWMVGAGSLGLIGPSLAAVLPMTPDMGLTYTVLALVVLICGGGASLGGTVVAGLLVGVVQNLGLLYLPKSYGGLLPYVLLVVVLVVRPGGLASLVPALGGRSR